MPAPRPGRPEASALIWSWRTGEAETRDAGDARRYRLRAALQALAGAAFGLCFYLLWSRAIAYAAFGIASIILLSGLLSPMGLYAGLHHLFEATGRTVGRIMTWVVLVPIFYLFFLPFGTLMRRGRRDALKRFFDSDAETYWEPHPETPPAARERQY